MDHQAGLAIRSHAVAKRRLRALNRTLDEFGAFRIGDSANIWNIGGVTG